MAKVSRWTIPDGFTRPAPRTTRARSSTRQTAGDRFGLVVFYIEIEPVVAALGRTIPGRCDDPTAVPMSILATGVPPGKTQSSPLG